MITATAFSVPGEGVQADNIEPNVQLFIPNSMTARRAADIVRERYRKQHPDGRPCILRVQNAFQMFQQFPWTGRVTEFITDWANGEYKKCDDYFSTWYNWYHEFWYYLVSEGVLVKECWLDEEMGFGPWHIIRQFHGNDEDAREYFRTVCPLLDEEFFKDYDFKGKWWGLDHEAIEAYNASLVVEDHPFSEEPVLPHYPFFRNVFYDLPKTLYRNPNFKCHNYNDWNPQNDIIMTRTENNAGSGRTWKKIPVGVTEYQAPEVYLMPSGNRWAGKAQAEIRWEQLLMHHNNICSMRLSGQPIEPWVAEIGHGASIPTSEMAPHQIRNEIILKRIELMHLGDQGIERISLWNPYYNEVLYRGGSLYYIFSRILHTTKINPNPAPPSAVPEGLKVLDTGTIVTTKERFMSFCV